MFRSFLWLICFGMSFSSFAQEVVGNHGTQTMNPDVSIIFDGVAGWWQHRPLSLAGDDPNLEGTSTTHGGGLTLQEAEISFSSIIDPYLRGDLFLTIPNGEGLEVEEGFITTTTLPLDLQIKAGKFRSNLGRQNGQHLHMQDFVRRPLLNQNFLGVDGLSAPGVQLSWLSPLPFYSVLALEAFAVKQSEDTDAPVQTFGGGGRDDVTMTATWKNFFELDESRSLGLGFNFAQGRSSTAIDPTTLIRPVGYGQKTKLYGADLYFKYKPANTAQSYTSVAWQTEYFQRHFDGDDTIAGQNDGGLYTQVVCQFARRWYVGARIDFLGIPKSQFVLPSQRYSSSLTFAATEFSRFRIYGEDEVVTANDYPQISPLSSMAVLLQFEVSYGVHGAHPF